MSGIASPRSSKAVPVALRTAILWVAVWPCAAPALDVEALLRRPGADLSAVAMTVAEQGWPTARELRQLAVAGPPDIVPAAMRASAARAWARVASSFRAT